MWFKIASEWAETGIKMTEAERLLRIVLLVALLHSSPLAPPLSLSDLLGWEHQQETRSAPSSVSLTFSFSIALLH